MQRREAESEVEREIAVHRGIDQLTTWSVTLCYFSVRQ